MIGVIGNEDAMRFATKKCNMFAIAKLGSPNMIFPQTLDVQVRNFQDDEQYLQIADYFFPENSKS